MATATMKRPGSDTRIIPNHRTEVTIEVRRGLMELEGFCNDYLEAEFEFPENETAPAHIEVKWTSKWAYWFKRCDQENIFIHAFINGRKWTGRVDRCRKKKVGKKKTVIAELVSDYVWFEAMMAWGAPHMPLQIQAPRRDIEIAPACTMVATYTFKACFRLQANLYRFPIGFWNNPIDNWWKVEQWSQPCVMLPVDPLFDTSGWSTLVAQMTPLDQLFQDLLREEHLLLTAEAFVPGRDEQPHPGITLTKPCIVFKVVDKHKKTGSKGTILDGLFNTIIDTIEPFVKGVVGIFSSDSVKYSVEKYFGQDLDDPWVVFREGDDTDIEESEVVIDSPQAMTGIVGGHSPDWLNKGITLLVNSAIQGALSAVGIGFLGELISGELDDILFAYQSATNRALREQFGIFALPEAFDNTGTTAFTFDGAQALQALMWAIRPKRSFTCTLNDGKPFIPFVHFKEGDPIGWEDDEEIYTDYVRRIVVTDNRKARAKIRIMVGDGLEEEEPIAAVMKRITRVKQAFDYWTLASA